jgi:hypothetical protein
MVDMNDTEITRKYSHWRAIARNLATVTAFGKRIKMYFGADSDEQTRYY